jgi:hypothetical protein
MVQKPRGRSSIELQFFYVIWRGSIEVLELFLSSA